MNSRVARAVAAVVIGLATLGIVAPASVASSTAGTVSLSVSTSEFSAAKPGTPVRLRLSIEDTVGSGIPAGTATVRVNRTPFSSRSALTKWLNGTTKDAAVATVVTTVPTASVDAGLSRVIPVEVSPKGLGLGASGVYAISVSVTAGGSNIGGARTAISWKPSSTEPVPFAIAAPLTLPAASGDFIPAKTLEDATAPDGLLTRQLNDLADTPIAIGIDPRLIASIRILGKSAPESARAWLGRLATVTNETFPLAWADADLTIAQQAGTGSPLRVKPLTYAIDPDLFQPAPTPTETPDPTATATPDSGSNGGSNTDASTDPPLPITTGDLTTWNYTIAQLGWPAANTVEKSDMVKFGEAGYSSMILSSSNVRRSATGNYFGSAASIGAIHVATSDEQLSTYLANATMATTRAASNAAATDLAAALNQISVGTSGPTPIMLATLPRNWDDDGLQLDRVLASVYGRAWVTTASLTQVLAAKPTATSIVSKPQAAERISLVRALLDIERRDARFASVVENPEQLTSSRRLVLLSVLSNEWIGDDAGWNTVARGFLTSGRKIVRSVQLLDSSSVFFPGDSGSLPVTIENAYSQPVTVYLTLHPSTTLLSVDPKYTNFKVDIPAESQAKARIPVQALSNGKVTVRVTLKSVTGRVIGTQTSVKVNVQAGWESIGTLVVGILVLAIFGLGIFRNIRRRRSKSSRSDGSAEAREAEATPDADPRDERPGE